ncbi:hypothetical protein GGH96_005398 [Coemansia sp. RSA 1972]|nr:hypothetical protein GGH96_005398 [Coemansia sp. RSA 1972]
MSAAAAAQASCAKSSASDEGSAANNGAATPASVEVSGKSTNKEFVRDSLPLAALFGTAPMDESEILPPSILQNMNMWMNDSFLTAAVGIPGLGNMPSVTGSVLPPSLPTSSSQVLGISSQVNQNAQAMTENMNSLSNLIPMDFALGLPAWAGQFNTSSNGAFSSPTVALDNYASMANFGALPVSQRGENTSDFLQNLNQQFNQLHAPMSINGSYSGTSIHSPLSTASPNPLLGSADMGTYTPFPTAALASLNLVNPLDAFSGARASPAAFGVNNGAAPISANVGLASGSMQPVSTSTSAALGLDSAIQPFHQRPSLGDTKLDRLPRHNTMPMSQGRRVSLATSAATGTASQPASHMPLTAVEARDNVLANNANLQTPSGLVMFSSPQSMTSAAPSTPMQAPAFQHVPALAKASLKRPSSASDLLISALSPTSSSNSDVFRRQHMPLTSATENMGISVDMRTLTGTLEAMQASSPHLAKDHHICLPASPNSSASVTSIAQMNSDSIPQMLKDAVTEHPELGSVELVYNLLITHAVHDCTRIGMYNAHLFWMRVKQYRLPKFHLFASIADATRSWTLSDELHMALPPNLDETCYALAIKDAPTDISNPNVLTAVGLLVLAAYEFKSARFAPMVEHSCLAYKIIIHIKFRGAPFPWRGAKKRHGSSGVDLNYQLLIRAFWRLSMSLYYSTEIFRLDAPDDREFLPEIPKHDSFIIRHVFVPDESEEFGFRAVLPPYEVHDSGKGDLTNIICELVIKQYKIANRFNRVLRGEKNSIWYINYMLEWDRQMLEWRESLPSFLRADLDDLARNTQPLDGRRRRINLWGLSENEMWQKRHQWNQDVGLTVEVLYVHMMFEMARIKAHRVGLMMLMHEDLDMVRNFQYSKAFTIQELPRLAHKAPVTGSYEEDRDLFHHFAEAANEAAAHVYDMLKFNQQFGLDLHAYSTIIISTLLQVSLVYVGQVQSRDMRLAWHAMLRLSRILAMIRSLDRWGPALYIFTNILKALGRPELILQMPSPEVRAELAADTRRPAAIPGRSTSVDSTATGESVPCMDTCCRSPTGAAADTNDASSQHSAKGKRKNTGTDEHGDEKRYEFSDHHHGDPHSVSSVTGSPVSDEEDVTNPFPPDHVISYIMREQKVSTATFFSPTLPVLAATLLHTNSS